MNKNPENYFAQIEQAAFEPSNVVPGIWFSPDKMLQGRIFAYADAHRYRIGPNYHLLPVNQAKNAPVRNYGRDGHMAYGDNGGPSVNYEPNSSGGPVEHRQFMEPSTPLQGPTGRYDQNTYRNDNYTQPGDLFRLMKPEEQDRFVDTVVNHMKPAHIQIQQRQVEHWRKVDASLGERIAQGLGHLAPPDPLQVAHAAHV